MTRYTRDLRVRQLELQVSPDRYRAMPSARAAAASRWSLFHVSSIASIAIAAFCVVYFGLQLLRGVL